MKRIFYLIAIITASSVFAQHQFNEVTSSYGISASDGLGHAVGWGDINNDGLMDFAISNQSDGDIWLYINDGSSFTNIAYSAGISSYTGDKFMFADLNGDYYPELILRTRSGTTEVFRNNGNETFSNISAGISGQAFAVDDFDNDGNLDILSFTSSETYVYTNDGSMNFTSHLIGSTGSSFYTSATCLDYNNDTYTDIYFTEDSDGECKLLRNNGDLTFTDVTDASGTAFPGHVTAVTAGDYNNDGYIDLYVGSYDDVITDCKLFKNNGDNTFTDVASSMGTGGYNDTRTSSFVDYNNDGYLDIFSSHHETYNWSNLLYRSNSASSFTNVAQSMGVADPGNLNNLMGDYFSVAWADFDNDGSMDYFSAGHIDKYNLMQNQNNPGNGFVLNLKGVQSNHSAIGTKAVLWINGQATYRTVTGGHGARDFNSLRLHLGIGSNTAIDSLILYWKSGIVQRLYNSNISMNGVTEIFESGAVIQTPNANFYASSTTIFVGETVTFTDNSLEGGAPITNWEWSFTGGNPSSFIGQNPTAITYNTAGTYEVSLVVTNSYGSDTETKTSYITVLPLNDAFSLDFELPENYSQVFNPWNNIDNDGKTTYTSSDCDFPGEGSAFSFMAFNPSDAGFSLASTHGGERGGMAICPSDASQSDNWLISDKFTVGTGVEFKMWVLSPKPGTWGNETYNVLVSTTDMDLASFNEIASNEEAPDTWTQRIYDLSSFVGQDIYVAIQHVSVDKFMFWVDDIEITGGTTNTSKIELADVNIYPNPATENIQFTMSNEQLLGNTIKIVNINGQLVKQLLINDLQFVINVSDLEKGIYFVRIIGKKNIINRKIEIY